MRDSPVSQRNIGTGLPSKSNRKDSSLAFRLLTSVNVMASEIAHRRGTDAEVHLAAGVARAVEFKPGAAAGIENRDEARKSFASRGNAAHISERRRPRSASAVPPHETGRAIVQGGDLEVAWRARLVANDSQRNEALGRRLEHGLDETELPFALLQVNQKQMQPPTVGKGHGDKVVKADRAMHDPIGRQFAPAGPLSGVGKKLLQGERPVHRKLGDLDVLRRTIDPAFKKLARHQGS